jgi:polyhydroxyalkanoate synthesis regulator phasin
MRAVQVEVVDEHVVPTEAYVDQYNAYIEELERQAEKLQAEMQAQEAGDDSGPLN